MVDHELDLRPGAGRERDSGRVPAGPGAGTVTREGADSFWETEEAVERFTGKQPDVRLLELLQGYPEPGNVRVLDVGCAAGRNTLVLAELGFDVYAIDSSVPMVGRTRERVAGVLGPDEAERR
ncbi:MAG: methyltransferase domain-containing protein, partial [Gemmatimonadetes bacterium]|nr:methyltransferase domain-containing protein [Gemmatimonadota bacterium]